MEAKKKLADNEWLYPLINKCCKDKNMITKDKLKDMLKSIGFTENKDVYSEFFKETDATLKVDFKKEELIYSHYAVKNKS